MIARCERSRSLVAAAAATASTLALATAGVGAGAPTTTTLTVRGTFEFPAGHNETSFTRRWTVDVSLVRVSIDLPSSARIVFSLKRPNAPTPVVFRRFPTSTRTHCRAVATRMRCDVGVDDFDWGWSPPGRWVFTLQKPTPKPAVVKLTLQFALGRA